MSDPSPEQITALVNALKPWLKHPDDCGATKPPYTYCSCGLNFAFQSVLAALSDPLGPLGEAGARLRALVAQWIEDEKARLAEAYLLPYDIPRQRITSAAITAYERVLKELDALLSAPVVSRVSQSPNSAAGNQWGAAPVISPPLEECCQSCGRELSLICFPCAENGPPRKDAAAPVVTQEGE